MNRMHESVTYKVGKMIVEVPVLGEEADREREKINDLARKVYEENGSLEDEALRVAEREFEMKFAIGESDEP